MKSKLEILAEDIIKETKNIINMASAQDYAMIKVYYNTRGIGGNLKSP